MSCQLTCISHHRFTRFAKRSIRFDLIHRPFLLLTLSCVPFFNLLGCTWLRPPVLKSLGDKSEKTTNLANKKCPKNKHGAVETESGSTIRELVTGGRTRAPVVVRVWAVDPQEDTPTCD